MSWGPQDDLSKRITDSPASALEMHTGLTTKFSAGQFHFCVLMQGWPLSTASSFNCSFVNTIEKGENVSWCPASKRSSDLKMGEFDCKGNISLSLSNNREMVLEAASETDLGSLAHNFTKVGFIGPLRSFLLYWPLMSLFLSFSWPPMSCFYFHLC